MSACCGQGAKRELMRGLEKLLALDAIKTVFHRRIRYMDTKQWHLYAALHTADAVTETYGDAPPVIGSEAIAQAIETFMQDPKPITSVHHVHTPEINFTSETTANGIWPMEDRLWWSNDDREEWLHGFGHYHEAYRKEGDNWLISHRRLTRLRVTMSEGFAHRH